VLGGMAAPRARALEDWINEDALFDELVTVAPYVSDELIELVQDGSSEARMVSVRLDSAQMQAASNEEMAEAGLYSAAAQIGRELDLGPEVDVEVILRVRGRADSATEDTRRSLGDLGRRLVGREDMRGAKVEVVNLDQDSQSDRELVDLVKYRIATKEEVSVLDEDGHQVRIPSAVNAISRAVSKLQIGS
jgi:hypothetical protein